MAVCLLTSEAVAACTLLFYSTLPNGTKDVCFSMCGRHRRQRSCRGPAVLLVRSCVTFTRLLMTICHGFITNI